MHRLLSLLAGTTLAATALAQSADLAPASKAELLADADARASFMQDQQAPANNAGGYVKNKFTIGGGDNTLAIGGFFQTRYILDSRQDQADPNDITQGFQARRTRVNFSGNIWDKNLTFKVEGDIARNSGAFILTDAFGRYQWDNGVHVRWGQFKIPLLREQLVSDTLQLTVERSVTDQVFNQSRSQGLEFGYTDKKWRLVGSLSDGINQLNTDFTAESADFGLTGRAELLFAGEDFKRFDDFTSWKGADYAGMIGAAIHWQSGGETGGTTDRDVTEATIDVSVEGNGWNAFVEGVWRNIDAPGSEADDFGIVAQGGIFATEQLEFFARYDVVIPDVGDNFNSVTAGLNYYVSPKSHAVKFTADAVYYLDPTTDNPLISQNTGTPVLTDPEGDQVALRLQLQVVF